MQYKESHIVPVVVVTSGDVRALTTKKWGIRPPVIKYRFAHISSSA